MRLFVAMDVPEPVRERAWRAAAPLRKADLPVKWVGPDRLHLTLKFLGETELDRVPEVGRTLDHAAGRFEPMELRLTGLGAFPSLEAPRVLWLGLVAPPALADLQAAIDAGLGELGFEPEERAFHAHVTLGRARRRRGREALAKVKDLADRVELDATYAVGEVQLMRSVLRPEGARYSVVSSHRLSAGK